MLPCDVDDLTLTHYFFEVEVVFRMVEIVKFDKFTTIHACRVRVVWKGREEGKECISLH